LAHVSKTLMDGYEVGHIQQSKRDQWVRRASKQKGASATDGMLAGQKGFDQKGGRDDFHVVPFFERK
jgi:hypothetical protein